jgi:hypothetical protein
LVAEKIFSVLTGQFFPLVNVTKGFDARRVSAGGYKLSKDKLVRNSVLLHEKLNIEDD